MKILNIYYNTSFKGHYPVGTSALVVSENAVEAAKMLQGSLILHGLEQEVREEDMVQISPAHENVFILNDGDY